MKVLFRLTITVIAFGVMMACSTPAAPTATSEEPRQATRQAEPSQTNAPAPSPTSAPTTTSGAHHPLAIVSISVCSPTGAGGSGSCPSGSFDTHRIVLATDGTSINSYVSAASDEHSSVFAPGTLDGNIDYLFFVAGGTELSRKMGAVVVSGGTGPDENGQWTFDFP
jgi:hypothetical protein